MTNSLSMQGHDLLLVAISLAIAIAASYTALDLGGQVRASVGWVRGAWLATAALALGGGIWAMHFVAMLAFRLPIPMTFSPGLTGLSLVIAVVVTGLGFSVVGRRGGGRARDAGLGGLLMGGGIAAMHYTGMAAMNVPATLQYDGTLVTLSVLIAVGAAAVALWWTRRDAGRPRAKIGAGIVMGLAIAGMHYTAMAAATWAPHDDISVNGAAPHGDHAGLGQTWLALGVTATTVLVLALALLAALFDRRFAVSAKLEAQAALAESEARLRDLLATLDLGAAMVRDSEGIISFWSKGCERIYGWSEAEAVGQNTRGLLHTVFPMPQVEIEAALERDGEWAGDLRQKSRDGRELVVATRKVLRRGLDGRPIAVLEALADVTTQRQAEAALRRSQAETERQRRLYEAILTNTPDFSYIFDLNHRFTYANETLLKTWGQSREEAIGKTCLELGYEPWHAEMHDREIEQVIATKQSVRGEVPFTGTSGRRIYDYIFIPVVNPDGQIEAVAGTTRDVTDYKQIEETLARHRDKLEQLVEERTAALLRAAEDRRRAEETARQSEKLAALGQLTGGVAHDFNNLLQVVVSGASLLRRPGLADERRVTVLDAMVQAVQKGRELNGRLLAFARRQPLRPEIVEVGSHLAGMSDLLHHTLGPDLMVATDIAPDLWPVHTDPSQFEVAVLNLAVNARDAMPKGGRLTIQAHNVALEATAERAAGAYVCIAVKDTGTGIPPHILGRVVEPFFTTKDLGKGTGLGLSQVHGFAKQSGGDLLIESELGRGTTVFFHLPRASAAVGAAGGGAALIKEKRPPALLGGGRTVLVVEDNQEVAVFACSLLEEVGYTTRRAGTAAEALAVLADNKTTVDAVFSDVVMPGSMSGVELAAELSASHPHLPVVLTTGYSEHFATSGVPEGIETIGKPYHAEEVALALERALARHERATLEVVTQ